MGKYQKQLVGNGRDRSHKYWGGEQMPERKLIRLENYDYSQPGYYFVTVCTKDHADWFGLINNGQMNLNEFGGIVERQWLWLGKQYPYINLDTYVIMPNHFHGILVIVGNGRDRSLQNKIKPVPELLGVFKTTSSKLIHLAGGNGFLWQKSYYDHVIRGDKELNLIREYIIFNPAQWEKDEDNPPAQLPQKKECNGG